MFFRILTESEQTLRTRYADQLPEEILNTIVKLDPSKTKKYSEWMAKQFIKAKDKFAEKDHTKLLAKIGKLAQKFDWGIIHKKLTNLDLPSYSIEKAEEVLSQFQTHEEEEVKGKKEIDVIYGDPEKDDFYIVKPLTHKASKIYGSLVWCTAYASSMNWNMYRHHNIVLFYIIDKKEPNESLRKVALASHPDVKIGDQISKQDINDKLEEAKHHTIYDDLGNAIRLPEDFKLTADDFISKDGHVFEAYDGANTMISFRKYMDTKGLPDELFEDNLK